MENERRMPEKNKLKTVWFVIIVFALHCTVPDFDEMSKEIIHLELENIAFDSNLLKIKRKGELNEK